jgi:hypothetical protein
MRLPLLCLVPAGFLAMAILSADEPSPAPAPPAFENVIRLPQDFYTLEGQSLRQGSYRVRVQFDSAHPALVFESSDQARTVIDGKQTDGVHEDAPSFPIAGTMFLRSTDDPVGTDAERHHSKTGHPQYQETERDWKATLRMYRHEDAKRTDVLLLFQRRLSGTRWESTEFWVQSTKP